MEDVYNGYGQLIQQFQADAGSVNTLSTPSVQYGFTPGTNYSRLTTVTYPDGRVVTYNYNGNNGIDNAISRVSGMSDSGGNIESYNYLGLSQIVREIRPGSVLTYVKASGALNGDAGDMYTGLDRFGRVDDQLWTTSDTPGSNGDTLGTITDEFQYGFDADSNVLYKDNMVHSADSELYHTNGASETSAYDQLNRLTAFSRGTLSASGLNGTTLDTVSTASVTNSWSLDALGNSTNTGGTSRTFNSKNQIATYGGSSTITYDHDGNMTKDQAGNTYGFDAWNRLVTVSLLGQSTSETYTYNAGGERPGLTINNCTGSVTSSYYSTQWQDLEDDITSGGTTTKDTYLWSEAYIDELVARDSSAVGRLYAQQDANHDITSLINTSARVVERFVYDPYGARTVLTSAWATTTDFENWVYGFQGGRLDPLDGLVNFRNRDLNPTTGTWMEQDPAGYINGPNTYQFELSSPSAGLDPSGLLYKGPLTSPTTTGTGAASATESAIADGNALALAAYLGYLAGKGIYESGAGNYIGTTEAGEADADAFMDLFHMQRPPSSGYYPALPNPLTKTGGSGRRPPGGRPPIPPPMPPGKPPCFVAGTEVLMADDAAPSVAAVGPNTTAVDPLAVSRSQRRRETEREIGVGLIVLGAYGAFVIHRMRRILLLKQAAEQMEGIHPIEMPLHPISGRRPPLPRLFSNKLICNGQLN